MNDSELIATLTNRLRERLPDHPAERIFVIAAGLANAGVDNAASIDLVFSELENEAAPAYDEFVGQHPAFNTFRAASA